MTTMLLAPGACPADLRDDVQPDRQAAPRGGVTFVDIEARSLLVQQEPITLAEALVAMAEEAQTLGPGAGRYTAVVAVPFAAYATGLADPRLLSRYLARSVIDPTTTGGMTGTVTHRILAVADAPEADAGQVAYVSVAYDVAGLQAALIA